MKDKIIMALAKYFWIKGKPIKTGYFLLQESTSKVYFEWQLKDAPGNRENIVYWKRVNAPLPPPILDMSYSHRGYLCREFY